MYHRSAFVAVFPEKKPERPRLFVRPLWYSLLYSGVYFGIGVCSVREKLDVLEPELLLELGFELLLLEVGLELLRELLLLLEPPPRDPPFALMSEAETAPKIRLIVTINEIIFSFLYPFLVFVFMVIGAFNH